MPLGHCPDCEKLVGISPTHQPLPGRDGKPSSSRYWRVDAHAKDGRVCSGSGKLI